LNSKRQNENFLLGFEKRLQIFLSAQRLIDHHDRYRRSVMDPKADTERPDFATPETMKG
jgi:hypothetical protein